jgi:hypothetical protein
MRLRTVLVTVVVVAGVTAASASSETPRDLPVSYLFSGPGHMTKLASGATYQASEFPIALRVTTPNGSWSGTQWKTGRLGCCGTINGVGNYGGQPFFGWAAFGQGGTNPQIAPQGFFVIETAYARTSSVAATVTGLRTRGTGATYEPSTQVKLAGYSGIQFDGKVVGTKHLFVPFGAPTHNAHYFPDSIAVEDQGQVFRFIVLNAHGKTVVVFLVNAGLAADKFPTFLAKADQILNSLHFPDR